MEDPSTPPRPPIGSARGGEGDGVVMMGDQERADEVALLQDIMVARAVGESHPQGYRYEDLRRRLLQDPAVEPLLPGFVRASRNLAQFWPSIRDMFPTYKQRREIIWNEFRPVLDRLEGQSKEPTDDRVTGVLEKLDEAHVRRIWERAIDRRESDPEGAITAARTLLESVCKHILDDAKVTYAEKDDLPKLYGLASKELRLAPGQHEEPIFKQILGGCHAVVEGLGSMRNKLGDAHGKGKKAVKPAARHAALAVNLAGAMAMFLVETWATKRAAVPISV